MYNDGQYLENNKAWGAEDSPYKASLVIDCITQNGIGFATCADVGCGAGLVTEILAEKYSDAAFTGYEPSQDAQRFWNDRKRLANLSYTNRNIFEEERPADLVLCLDVFEHVEDYFGFLRALRNKGKSFIFNIPLDMNLMKILTPGIRYAREEVGHLHYFSEYTALQTLRDCGYKIRGHRLSVAYLATMPRNIRQWLVLPFRLITIAFGKSLAARVFGGISLVVYAQAE